MKYAILAFAATLAFGGVRTAAACGGFFCSSAPIVQAQEVVVYGYEDDGTLTMAVQVQYEGVDDEFAWILPVPVPPDEITLGTDELFTQLLDQTAPTFTSGVRTDGTCRSRPSCDYPSYSGGCSLGCAAGEALSADAGAFFGFADSGAAADAGSVVVHSTGTVGPYDTVVLGASTAAEVIDWLGTNGYDVPASSAPLLEPYAAQGFAFIALRLTSNSATNVIRPIVMRMPTDEACLPIRLTAIASTPTLPIVLFFLGDAQVRPENYSHAIVELDQTLFQGAQWFNAVAARVAQLDGRAFATDYADVVPTVDIALPDVDDLATETDVNAFFAALRMRGYESNDTLDQLVVAYTNPPVGQNALSYARCLLSSFDPLSECGTPLVFSAALLAGAIETEITAPAREAEALVERHPFLTRLSTVMRPENMTIDPLFTVDADLPDVPRNRHATFVTECSEDYIDGNAPVVLEIGDTTSPISRGVMLSDELYCSRMGGTLDTGESSGCTSVVGVGTQYSGLALTLLAWVAFRVRRRRRR